MSDIEIFRTYSGKKTNTRYLVLKLYLIRMIQSQDKLLEQSDELKASVLQNILKNH